MVNKKPTMQHWDALQEIPTTEPMKAMQQHDGSYQQAFARDASHRQLYTDHQRWVRV